MLNKNVIPPKYKARIEAKVKVELFKSNDNVITQNYKSNEPGNEKEVEYLKEIIKAKDEIIEMLKKQIEKD